MRQRSLRSLRLLCVLAAVLAASCAGADPLDGTWRQTDAVVSLPDGTPVDLDATVVLAGGSFEMHLALSTMGLSDVIDAYGTYEDTGDELALTWGGFTIDPASGNEARVDENGRHCITQNGFGGAEVCFPSPQSSAYGLEGDALTLTIQEAIITQDVGQTELSLTREE